MIKETTGEERDWAKEERLAEMLTEERFGYKAPRRHGIFDDYPGSALVEHVQSNADSADRANHRYDEQNN